MSVASTAGKGFFSSMAGGALMVPALFLLPALYSVFIGLGFTRENIIEESVYAIWASEGSDYYQDRRYATDVGRTAGASSLLAIATSRDGENILTAERLDEINERMERLEAVTVEYKDEVYGWEDVCASNNIGLGTVYQFPCVRLTPMDLFSESRWYMSEQDRVSWFKEGIQKGVIVPRVPRFAFLQNGCLTQCGALLQARQAGNPLLLFGDLSAMAMTDPCRMCVESTFEATMDQITSGAQGVFGIMNGALTQTLATLSDPTKIQQITDLLAQVQSILSKLDRKAIEEFFMYYTSRRLYGQLGAQNYNETYVTTAAACNCLEPLDDRGPYDQHLAIAGADLINHADSPFSSVNTAGNPLPFLPGKVPQGGSGISLSGDPLTSVVYFDATNFGEPTWAPLFGADNLADPDDADWATNVASDPIFKWFIAGETKMTAHCGNEISPFTPFQWCTKFSEPLEDEERTEQHFAKMWYDLLLNSPGFLNLVEGESDPYTWTNGEGCEYSLGGSRFSYTGKNESTILTASSRDLYFIDEGASIGVLDKSLLIGGTVVQNPSEKISADNQYEKVTTFQNIYPTLIPEGMVERVKNCNRPGGPLDISVEDAENILESFKRSIVDTWSEDWDKETGKVQFTGFYDSIGVAGTFNFVLRDISDDSATLTLVSIAIIAAMSMAFLFSCDMVQSRVGITFVGVTIVVLSFVGALGLAILCGIKININIAWTLPFIMIGLGVDDMYIVLNAMKDRKGSAEEDFIAAMREVIAPVSMTSLVNLTMFAFMNIVDIGAVYKTAQAALISVIFLWGSIVFCFPVYCYLDMKRQDAGKCDVLVCMKGKGNENSNTDDKASLLSKTYETVFLGKGVLSLCGRVAVLLATLGFFIVGIIGITDREVGVGLEEFFPDSHQASVWSEVRGKDLETWPIGISWGALDYTNPQTQLQMIKQYEDVVATTYVTENDTRWLWIADFISWTTSHCEENFDRDDPSVKECGADQLFTGDAPDANTSCEGTWVENTIGLKLKNVVPVTSDVCVSNEGGICLTSEQMFPTDLSAINAVDTDGKSYCPVVDGWSEQKFKFCIEKWRQYTGGRGGLLVVDDTATPFTTDTCPEGTGEFYRDDEIQSPIPISSSPTLYANKLTEHKYTVKLIKETRAICDDDKELHCFMTGIPFDFWEQYLTVDKVLVRLCCVCTAAGFGVATLFLFFQLNPADESFGRKDKIIASLCGGLLIALTIILCLVPVIGISSLADVNLTAFSNMAFVMSVSFATEYSVHVVHRFLSAPTSIKSASDRVAHTMKFLIDPLTLSFVSSSIGVVCLAFTDFSFNERFFFRPLMIVMAVTYLIGSFFLPMLLTLLDFDVLKVGHKGEEIEEEEFKEQSSA